MQTREWVKDVAADTPPSSNFGAGRDHLSAAMQQLTLPSLQNLLRDVDERLFSFGTPHAGGTHVPCRPVNNGSYVHPARALAESLDGNTFYAREASEKSVPKAARQIEMSGDHDHEAPDDLDPHSVLTLANRLIETGQVSNYLRAAEPGAQFSPGMRKPGLRPPFRWHAFGDSHVCPRMTHWSDYGGVGRC